MFIAWTGTDVIEVPADGLGPARQLTVPRGWLVAGNGGIAGRGPGDLGAAGDGILVQASWYQTSPEPAMLGWWDLHTRTVRVLGRLANGNDGLIGATTLPGGHACGGHVPGFLRHGARLPLCKDHRHGDPVIRDRAQPVAVRVRQRRGVLG